MDVLSWSFVLVPQYWLTRDGSFQPHVSLCDRHLRYCHCSHVTSMSLQRLLNGVSSFEGVEMCLFYLFIALTRCRRLPLICSHSDTRAFFQHKPFIMAELYWSQSTMSCSITSSCDLLNDLRHNPTGRIFLDIYFKTNQCLALFVDVWCVSRHVGTFSWHVPEESKPCFLDLRRIGLILIKARLLNLPALSGLGR